MYVPELRHRGTRDHGGEEYRALGHVAQDGAFRHLSDVTVRSGRSLFLSVEPS